MEQENEAKVPPVAPGDFKAGLLERLKDPAYAKLYLLAAFDDAAKEESWDLLKLASQDVVDAMMTGRAAFTEG